MEVQIYLAFVLASIILIIIPGPNVLVVVSTSVAYGKKRGLQTVLGTSSAMLIQLIIATLATNVLVESITAGLAWLRWLGVVYLFYLGSMHFLYMKNHNSRGFEGVSATGSFSRGFVVSLTNPKTILFFSAFLPQFVSHDGDYINQITVLSGTFLLLATVLDSAYAILAGYVRKYLQGQRLPRVNNGLSGILYLGASAWLAVSRKT